MMGQKDGLQNRIEFKARPGRVPRQVRNTAIPQYRNSEERLALLDPKVPWKFGQAPIAFFINP